MGHVLIVDDDPALRQMMTEYFVNPDHSASLGDSSSLSTWLRFRYTQAWTKYFKKGDGTIFRSEVQLIGLSPVCCAFTGPPSTTAAQE
jgi:hypothetical protein